MTSWAFAPAKVNLFLHVGPVGPDGYHPLCSLAVFADVGDVLTLERADRFALNVTGEFADGAPASDDNLVIRAVDALCAVTRQARPRMRLTLEKRLPAAAGLGGGSSDAAAALRLLASEGLVRIDEARLGAVAETIGADGPACLAAAPVLMQGRGERLSPPPALPTLHAVLLNPRAPASTAAVYRAYDGAPAGDAACADIPEGLRSAADVAAWLGEATRNDLETPGLRVQPAAADVLAWLRARKDLRLARLSGSGATGFALLDDAESARRLAAEAGRERPDWWARACRLGGPWPQGRGNPEGSDA